MVFAVLLCGEPQVAACLARDAISEGAPGARQVVAREVSREPHENANLCRDDFISYEMQSDHLRSITLIKMAPYRVADHHSKLIQVVGFRHNRRIDGAGNVAPFGILGYDE